MAVVGIVDGCCRAVQGGADGGGRGVTVVGVVGGERCAVQFGARRGRRGVT